MAVVEELVYDLDFKFDKKVFDNFGKSLGSIVTSFAKFSAIVSAAEGVAFGIAKSVAGVNDELTKNSKRLNIATEDYQKFAFAAELGGAGADTLNQSLESLTKAQEDVLRGKGDLEAFGQLGINPADFEKSSDLLLAVSDSISTIQSDTEKINLLERIGIPRDMLQTLEGGSEAIRAAGKEFESLGGIVTGQQKKIAEEFNDNMTRLSTAFNGIKNSIGSALLEPFNDFVMSFTKFAKDNMKQIIAGFKKFFDVVMQVSKVIFAIMDRVFKLIMNIVNLMGGFENAVIAVGIAFGILKRKMLLAFAIPLAIGTALFLLIEDFVSFLQGKDSVFGDFFGNFGITGEGVMNMIKLIIKGFKALIAIALKVKDIIVDAFGAVAKTIGTVVDTVGGAIDSVKGAVGSVTDTIGEGISATGDFLGSGIDAIGNFFGGGDDTPATNNTNNSQNVVVNISGSQDPNAIVKILSSELQKKANSLFGNQ